MRVRVGIFIFVFIILQFFSFPYFFCPLFWILYNFCLTIISFFSYFLGLIQCGGDLHFCTHYFIFFGHFSLFLFFFQVLFLILDSLCFLFFSFLTFRAYLVFFSFALLAFFCIIYFFAHYFLFFKLHLDTDTCIYTKHRDN